MRDFIQWPTFNPDADYDGLPIICLNWAARRRRFRGVTWWVSYLTEPCDKQLWAEAGASAKIAADRRHLGHLFGQLQWPIDVDLCDMREAVGRARDSLNSVADTLSLALFLVSTRPTFLAGMCIPGKHVRNGTLRRWSWAHCWPAGCDQSRWLSIPHTTGPDTTS